jgi:hypothetical protein
MMKGMMPCPLMIRVAARKMSSPKFLLQIYLRGIVLVFLVVVFLRSLSRLREVKVFDKAVLMA